MPSLRHLPNFVNPILFTVLMVISGLLSMNSCPCGSLEDRLQGTSVIHSQAKILEIGGSKTVGGVLRCGVYIRRLPWQPPVMCMQEQSAVRPLRGHGDGTSLPSEPGVRS